MAFQRLGRLREREVVGGGCDGAVAAGEQDGDEGLFEIIAGALARDQRGAEPFELFPVEFVAVESAEADIQAVGQRCDGERGEECVGIAVRAPAVDGV